ncbi:putative transmembrane protein [Toxoplasma gondii RUB]|uniref:Transmembrane protein n=10 Tax=Toxoplasma gondii TaxID=5811 RepID=S7WFJ5_TOXGG|nr:hypothetical protein TGGT1_276830 [Toxoplasma gondii GT1]KAF4639040.1 hypothetical protein TGRH88_066490 [Toxoplasma gondii]KFG27996.1 putative transmembrane protein [Toxoplasma gondii p89]KFG33175.1 putative transmembrane protein [Toxoplasma gondii FOU]KFG34202.1 putative transmembrane protein [Toxoplasma gondii GAB2-2007-GAL-DOM2]KFG56868.1 putative transmembrane protein [Toxoplasma gondii RUB]KFG99437.1 putative transmembrane protein [Toxoplasma gondii VAND]KFH02223.1 putative transmem
MVPASQQSGSPGRPSHGMMGPSVFHKRLPCRRFQRVNHKKSPQRAHLLSFHVFITMVVLSFLVLADFSPKWAFTAGSGVTERRGSVHVKEGDSVPFETNAARTKQYFTPIRWRSRRRNKPLAMIFLASLAALGGVAVALLTEKQTKPKTREPKPLPDGPRETYNYSQIA